MRLVDQTNHPVELIGTAKRIVSVVPSQTELLHHLGLAEEVVGITKFCVHPKVWFDSKKRIGGTKDLNIAEIELLQPDLIIANKEENTKADIEYLRQYFQVYTSDISAVSSALQMILDIGQLSGKIIEAEELVEQVQKDFKLLPKITGNVLYLIWKNPYMSAGTGTFINELLSIIGLKNIHISNKRYDEITEKEIGELNPDFILLSSEPYPFKNKHVSELENSTNAKIVLVDGEMFSWYGSRLLLFSEYVNTTILKQLV